MISKEEILSFARTFGLLPTTVEKDYALSWMLFGIANHPSLSRWIFKGGTCLKKCYFETYRFSEDLDFTVPKDAIYGGDTIKDALSEVASIVYDASGIEIKPSEIEVKSSINKRGEETYVAKATYKPYQQGHFNAIETKELPEFLAKFHRNDARLYPQTRHALQLMMLTFVRTTELIGAKWEEFDFKNREWNIPAARMKMKRAHLVPLARQTIQLLEKQKELTGNWEWVFPNIARPKKHMSDCTILGALKRLGYRGRMTGHGFRALAMSTIKEKLHYRHEVVDRQLAHAPSDKLEAAYDRAKFLEERAVMMQDWADYLDKAGGVTTSHVIHFSEAAE